MEDLPYQLTTFATKKVGILLYNMKQHALVESQKDFPLDVSTIRMTADIEKEWARWARAV